MRVKNESLISGAIDLSSDWASNAILLDHVVDYSIQLKFSGSPSGTFKLQISNDLGNTAGQTIAQQSAGVSTWTTLVGSAQAIIAAGTHAWDITNAGHNWVRIIWTSSAPEGSLDAARAYTKGV